MALSPKEQALNGEEIAWADAIEKDIDTKLATHQMADVLGITPKIPFSIPTEKLDRVKFEVALRYQNVGWETKWAYDHSRDTLVLTRSTERR